MDQLPVYILYTLPPQRRIFLPSQTLTMSFKHFKKAAYRFDAGPLGHIEGLTVSDAEGIKPLCHYFGGLPYALPPIGPYRFRKPRPLPAFYKYGTKASPGRFTNQTAVCPQPSWRGGQQQPFWDEDCLQLNIYVPAGQPPSIKGWPVYFFIHGGFLQWGDPNFAAEGIAPLLSSSAFNAIIVAPAYRVNAFGFLTSSELQSEALSNGETVGNMGFWDQRTALEWTAAHVGSFGGDRTNITVGGYSAGSHSAFQQLAHELYHVSDESAVIRRVIMWSNSPGVQPKSLTEHQKQFDEVLAALKIPLSLPADEKLRRLRAIPSQQLVEIQDGLKLSEFRALTDGAFIAPNLIANINSGDFARRMKKRAMTLMNGECRDEHNLYQSWRTPANSYDAVHTRLTADYPEAEVEKLMVHYCGKSHSLPAGAQDWQDLFGRLYANMQVHCLERGFLNALVKGGLVPGKDILRYRFNWRAKCADTFLPPEWGVTHASDMAIWFWGLNYGDGLTTEEQEILRPWNAAVAAFVNGEDLAWGTTKIEEMIRLGEDGKTELWHDDRWQEGVEVWDVVNGSGTTGTLTWLKSKM